MTTLEKIYGNLKVISPVGPGRFYCQCQCEAKKTLIASLEELRDGKKTDCGCKTPAQASSSTR